MDINKINITAAQLRRMADIKDGIDKINAELAEMLNKSPTVEKRHAGWSMKRRRKFMRTMRRSRLERRKKSRR